LPRYVVQEPRSDHRSGRIQLGPAWQGGGAGFSKSRGILGKILDPCDGVGRVSAASPVAPRRQVQAGGASPTRPTTRDPRPVRMLGGWFESLFQWAPGRPSGAFPHRMCRELDPMRRHPARAPSCPARELPHRTSAVARSSRLWAGQGMGRRAGTNSGLARFDLGNRATCAPATAMTGDCLCARF